MEELDLKLVLSLLDELESMGVIENNSVTKESNKYTISFNLTE